MKSHWIVDELPLPLERVGHLEVDLGTIERALADGLPELEVVRHERLSQRGLGYVPHLVRPDPLVAAQREVDADLEAEDVLHHVLD